MTTAVAVTFVPEVVPKTAMISPRFTFASVACDTPYSA
jgi:hypothetical protein